MMLSTKMHNAIIKTATNVIKHFSTQLRKNKFWKFTEE